MPNKPQPAYPARTADESQAGRVLVGEGSPLTLPAGPYRLIVSGSPEPSSPQLVRMLAKGASEVVAVDSGAAACHAAGVTPDYLIGDLDSISDEAREWCVAARVPELTSNWDKDATDLELALGRCESNQFEGRTVVTCALGGRLDHLLASIGSLARHPLLKPVIAEDSLLGVLLDAAGPASSVALSELGCVENTTFSVMALLGDALVSEQGARWNLSSKTLPSLSDAGTSNYVVDAKRARVTVERGAVLVAVPRTGY